MSTRYELREIPGLDKEISDSEGQSKDDLLNQIDYGNGSSPFQKRITKLCYEFKDIIADSVSKNPAKVDEQMNNEIDEGGRFNNAATLRTS